MYRIQYLKYQWIGSYYNPTKEWVEWVDAYDCIPIANKEQAFAIATKKAQNSFILGVRVIDEKNNAVVFKDYRK